MIRKLLILVAVIMAIALHSCVPAELQISDGKLVTFSVQIGTEASGKSSFSSDDTAVNNYKLFIYRDGTIVDSDYWDGSEPLSFTMRPGTYDFYVLCNIGDVASLGASPDNYRYSVASASSMLAYGIPMAAKQTVSVASGLTSVTLDVTRLVARYNLYVQRDYEDTNAAFAVTGVKVCQAAADVLAFGSDSTPTSVLTGESGDHASSSDLSCLNTDVAYDSTTGAVSFYMLENARGTLLPGNEDPWKKCYDAYGGLLSTENSRLCTYLEVTGDWTTAGASESVTYRMFLGKDNCTNFDVIRNSESNVILILSDTGKERDSWKIEDVTKSDSRTLAWQRTSMQMYRSGEYYVSLSVNPTDMVHNICYAADPSSPSWQRLAATSPGHLGYTDATNLITLDYDQSTRMLTVAGMASSSITGLFTFAVKAQTTDGKVSSGMTVDVASGKKVDYEFAKHCNVSNVKYVYSYGTTRLDLEGNSTGALDEQVNLSYRVGHYGPDGTFVTSATNNYSVQSSVVRASDSKGHFYFNPVGNHAFFLSTYGTHAGGDALYLRLYINGMLCEEHEVHSLCSWFVPTGDYIYSSTDFLDQSDCENPPTLFVTDRESMYLKLYDPVEMEILSPRLLFVPQDMYRAGSTAYENCGWDWNDMDDSGIDVEVQEDPEDHDLYFLIKKSVNGQTLYWDLGYNCTANNAVINIVTANSIPSGGVTEVPITMPLMVDNASAGAVSGQATVPVDFESVMSCNPAVGPPSAPKWLKFTDISSYGYLQSYDPGNSDDPYGLSVGYRKTSATTGELTFRKSFCGDLVLCWENITFGNTGKVGYSYKFTFKVRSVFDIGVIYVPVYPPVPPDTQYGFSPILKKVSACYQSSTRKGVVRMYPLVKEGGNGVEVFKSLVSHMKVKDYYSPPYGNYQWLSFSDENSELHEALLSARVSSADMGTYERIRVSHSRNSVADVVGSYDWTMDNTLVDGEVVQTYTGTTATGHLVVTSSVSKNTLRSRSFADGVYLRMKCSPAVESAKLIPGQSYEYSNASEHLYFKADVVDEFYNDRFNVWPWDKIVYE